VTNIIVVENESKWRQLFEDVLTAAGYRVRGYENGSEALEDIADDGCDLVILDIRMSPSGREVLRSIRRNRPELPVIVASSYAGYRDDPDFENAAAFWAKSADTGELVKAVSAVLARSVGSQL